jgi:hypothetical protein
MKGRCPRVEGRQPTGGGELSGKQTTSEGEVVGGGWVGGWRACWWRRRDRHKEDAGE